MSSLQKIIFIPVGFVLVLFIIAESISWLSLPNAERSQGFLINLGTGHFEMLSRIVNAYKYKHNKEGELYPGDVRLVGFTQLDPLLGYCMPPEQIQAMGYEMQFNTPVLRNRLQAANPLKIFITGGSTTDVALNHENWPKYLQLLLTKQNIAADLYVGGVGGYNSGQELLKAIRDAAAIKPDVYISYSGANELPPSSYVHEYEYDFFEREVEQTNACMLLPNTFYILAKKLGIAPLTLLAPTNTFNTTFWLNNMKTMHSIAIENNASFVGILQPVLGSGSHLQPKEMQRYAGDVAALCKSYIALRTSVAKHPDFLFDLSRTFDSINDPVFVDDCHLRKEYQPIIARHIFDILRQRKLL